MTEILLPYSTSIFVGNIYDAIYLKYDVVVSIVDNETFNKLPKKIETIYELFSIDKISIPIFDSLKDFQDLLDFYLLDDHNILVHCFDGTTLAPAFIIGYLMTKYGIRYKNVYEYFLEQYNKEINVEYLLGYNKLELDMENLSI